MLLIVSSPSGAGKSTLCKHLLGKFSEIGETVSVTTRKPREKEVEGIDYYFRSVDEFHKIVNNNEFLEHAEFCGNLYGTLKSEVKRIKMSGKKTILFEIDCQGAKSIKQNKQHFDVVSIFILPPSFEVLEERLRNRRSENQSDIEKRLSMAKAEVLHAKEFDFTIVNDKLDVAIEEICSIYLNESLKRV